MQVCAEDCRRISARRASLVGRTASGRGRMPLNGSRGGEGRCKAARVADVMEAECSTSRRFWKREMSLGEAVHEMACIRGTGDELGCHAVVRGDVVVGEGWSEGEPAPDEVQGSPMASMSDGLARRHRNLRQAQASADLVRRVTVTIMTAWELRDDSSW